MVAIFSVLSLPSVSDTAGAITANNLPVVYDCNGDANDRNGNTPNSAVTGSALISANTAGMRVTRLLTSLLNILTGLRSALM